MTIESGSDNHEEGSLLGQLDCLVHHHDLLELSIMNHLGPHVVEVVRLAHLVTQLSVSWHSLHLPRSKGTLRVIVAPDSTSPNLKKPVHMWVSLLKNLKNLFLNSGNFFSQPYPVSYSISQSRRWMDSGLNSSPISGFPWMMSLSWTSLISGSMVLSLILVQKSIQGRRVSPLNPTARSQNWQKKREREGSTKIWKGSWYLSLRKQMVLSAGKTLSSTSWKQLQKGGRVVGESSGFPTLVGSKLSLRQVQQAGLNLYCQRTLQALPVVQLILLYRTACCSNWADLRVDIIKIIL